MEIIDGKEKQLIGRKLRKKTPNFSVVNELFQQRVTPTFWRKEFVEEDLVDASCSVKPNEFEVKDRNSITRGPRLNPVKLRVALYLRRYACLCFCFVADLGDGINTVKEGPSFSHLRGPPIQRTSYTTIYQKTKLMNAMMW